MGRPTSSRLRLGLTREGERDHHGEQERRRWLTPERVLAGLARVFRVLGAPFVRYEIHGGGCATDLHVGIIAANHRSLFDVIAGLVCLHHFGHYPRLLVERRYVEKGLVGICAAASAPSRRLPSGMTRMETPSASATQAAARAWPRSPLRSTSG